MDYLAILDYAHMDNGFFLKTFADALGQQKGKRGLFLHTDSEYTDRIVQTGVMRDEAQVRSLKDLNHRLVALMADYGVPIIGMNGYQRNVITIKESKLHIDGAYLKSLPSNVHVLLNPLTKNLDTEKLVVRSISEIASGLITTLAIPEVLVFSATETDEIFTKSDRNISIYKPDAEISDELLEKIPRDLRKMPFNYKIISTNDFRDGNWYL